MTGRVVVVGSANIDVVLRVDQLPGAGETVLSGPAERGFGGKGANQAIAAAQAGAAVSMIGRVGDDPDGRRYLERLAGFGIDIQAMLATPGSSTGTAYVMVERDGENSIVVDPGANAAVSVADLGPLADLASPDVLLIQGELPEQTVAAAIRRAHAAGARIVFNLAPFAPLPAELLALADPLVLNEEEARMLQHLRDPDDVSGSASAPASLVVTRGSAGATWGDLALPAVPVPAPDVVDTTGAGDAFCGALAAALAGGADREAALGQALEAGALAVRRWGAQPAT